MRLRSFFNCTLIDTDLQFDDQQAGIRNYVEFVTAGKSTENHSRNLVRRHQLACWEMNSTENTWDSLSFSTFKLIHNWIHFFAGSGW